MNSPLHPDSPALDKIAIHGLQPYPAYKDTGNAWLGEVPKRWEVRRLRNAAEMRVSNVDKHAKNDEIPVRLCNYVDVYKHDRIRNEMPFMRATASREEMDRFRLERGDVLITKDSEAWNDIGVPALVDEPAEDLICGYHLALLRPLPDRLSGEYLFRCLQSTAVSRQFHVKANGVTRYGLSHAAIKSIWLPLPPVPEQSAIIRFLEYVDRRIRRYIAAKQKLIKLLEEQKQAIIHRAVTRGLDPNVRLKPSGVAWLGDVPNHWNVRRCGELFTQRNQTGFPDLPILEVSLNTGVRVRPFEGSARKQVMTDRDKYKRAAQGDLAYNMMRMWQGAVGVAPVDGLVSPAYVVARPVAGVDVRYFDSLFHTAAFMQEVDNCSRGIVKDRNRLYWEDFKQIPCPVPPSTEQATMSDRIGEEVRAVNRTRERVDRGIQLLREYRTRLVADVVTGKLDVRAAAASLPDEGLEPPPALDSDEDAMADEPENESWG